MTFTARRESALARLSDAAAQVEMAAWLATDVDRTAGALDERLSAPLQVAIDAIDALRSAVVACGAIAEQRTELRNG